MPSKIENPVFEVSLGIDLKNNLFVVEYKDNQNGCKDRIEYILKQSDYRSYEKMDSIAEFLLNKATVSLIDNKKTYREKTAMEMEMEGLTKEVMNG